MLSTKIAAGDGKWIQRDLLPGDHIKVDRGGYTHHGLYIGDGEVIHYNPTKKIEMHKDNEKFKKYVSGANADEVTKVTIDDFVRGLSPDEQKKKPDYNKLYVKHFAPSLAKDAPSREEVVRRAKSQLGNAGYHFVTNNCEDLADKTILGYSEHGQVKPWIRKYIELRNKYPQIMDALIPDAANELEKGTSESIRGAYKEVFGEHIAKQKTAEYVDTSRLDASKRKEVKNNKTYGYNRWVLQDVRELKPGDHVRVTRGMYWHHGIYVSPGEVISFKPVVGGEHEEGITPKQKMEVAAKKSQIVSESIGKFLGDGSRIPQVQIDSKEDAKKVRPTEKIVEMARKSVGKTMGGYDFFNNNCEHYANFVRKGEHSSEQSEGLKKIFNQAKKEIGSNQQNNNV